MTTYDFEIQEELEDSSFDLVLKDPGKVLKDHEKVLKENFDPFKDNSNSFKNYSLNDTEIKAIFFGLEKICQIPIGMTDKADIEKIKNYKKIAQKLIKQHQIILENGLIAMVSKIGSNYPEIIETQES